VLVAGLTVSVELGMYDCCVETPEEWVSSEWRRSDETAVKDSFRNGVSLRWEQRMRSASRTCVAHNLMFVETSRESNMNNTYVSSMNTRSPHM
jgi:hypothetical protein